MAPSLLRGEVDKAVSTLLDAMNYASKKALAAYNFGIIYDSNSDVHDNELGNKLLLIAGIDMATYRIAGLKQRSGDDAESLEIF